jgi:hypothetical protein
VDTFSGLGYNYATLYEVQPLLVLINIYFAEAILSTTIGILCGAYNIYLDTMNLVQISKVIVP